MIKHVLLPIKNVVFEIKILISNSQFYVFIISNAIRTHKTDYN